MGCKYNCVVTIKQVPDTKAVTAKAMKDDGTVNRAALPAIFNPEDLHALEAALAVKDRYGATVTVITMGPPNATEQLRKALFRGADRVILLTDRRAAASDTLATSYILSCFVRKLGNVDLVFCGRQAIDGDTAQVGPQLAEKLGLPQLTYVEEITELGNGRMVARRNVGNGWEIVEAKLPLLMTITDAANVPRPGGAKRIMKCKHARSRSEVAKEIAGENDPNDPTFAEAIDQKVRELESKGLLIEEWNLDTIGADLAWCGRDGSPTKVHRIQAVVLKGAGHRQFEASDEGVSELVHSLIEDRTLG